MTSFELHSDVVYPNGVVLHGAPGVGKSLVARALAVESSAHSIHLSAAQLLAEDSGTVLRTTFQEARREYCLATPKKNL